ncbi:hypothetical protein LJR255_004627 [Pararhizobium sp. LjRoot255]|uniref:hypothetical protein n=1 Tax=Pararhizobium sp. LjRoot255 TaxID=3342298 RepID=UPI003ECD907D
MLLYRGESTFNRRRRCYGLSWSANRSVAEAFAEDTSRLYYDGSVLLETLAPPEAILTKMPKRYGEGEYLVDRRYLRAVQVLRRIRQ